MSEPKTYSEIMMGRLEKSKPIAPVKNMKSKSILDNKQLVPYIFIALSLTSGISLLVFYLCKAETIYIDLCISVFIVGCAIPTIIIICYHLAIIIVSIILFRIAVMSDEP